VVRGGKGYGAPFVHGDWLRALAEIPGATLPRAIAFSKTGDPQLGEWDDANILGRYGDVPDDLAPFHVGLMISRSSLAGAERLNLLEIDAPSSRA
jgi:hypothetical protein